MKLIYIRTPNSGRCYECLLDPSDNYTHLIEEKGAQQFLHDYCGAIPSFLFPKTEEDESLSLLDLVCSNYGMIAYDIDANMEELTIKGDEGEPDLTPYAVFTEVGSAENSYMMAVYPYAITSFWDSGEYVKSVRLD